MNRGVCTVAACGSCVQSQERVQQTSDWPTLFCKGSAMLILDQSILFDKLPRWDKPGKRASCCHMFPASNLLTRGKVLQNFRVHGPQCNGLRIAGFKVRYFDIFWSAGCDFGAGVWVRCVFTVTCSLCCIPFKGASLKMLWQRRTWIYKQFGALTKHFETLPMYNLVSLSRSKCYKINCADNVRMSLVTKVVFICCRECNELHDGIRRNCHLRKRQKFEAAFTTVLESPPLVVSLGLVWFKSMFLFNLNLSYLRLGDLKLLNPGQAS